MKTDLDRMLDLLRASGKDFTLHRRVATTTIELFKDPVLLFHFDSADGQLFNAQRMENARPL